MSSISGIGNGFGINQLNAYSSSGNHHNEVNGGQSGNFAVQQNSFVSAIMQALTQINSTSAATTPATTAAGSTTTAASDSSSTASLDPQQALAAFMQALFASLQGLQQAGSSASSTAATASTAIDSDGDKDGSGASTAAAASAHHHQGGIGAKLQGLIDQLNSASATAATTSTSTGTAVGSTSSTALATLQQDFQNMKVSVNASGNQASLASFLQLLSQNLRGTNPGLNISTKA